DILHTLRRKFDFPSYQVGDAELEQYTLLEIEKLLLQSDKSLADYSDMPTPDKELLKALRNSLLQEEKRYNVPKELADHNSLFATLNKEQREVYDAVIESVIEKKGKLFFVYGPGGTGKTFLYKTIISRLRSEKKIVLPVASSGIAALLLPGGRTAHSRFKIPLNALDDTMCNINKGTFVAELIIQTELIIWDEAPMTHRHAFEALDRTLRDLMSSERPFGGKTVVLGGDFRQILPVIPQGSRQDSIMAAINRSYLWSSCHVYELKQNMRLNPDEKQFAKWLLDVGDGVAEEVKTSENEILTSQEILMDERLLLRNTKHPIAAIVAECYEDLQTSYTKQEYLTERAILTPKNDAVDEVNQFLLDQIPGEVKEYYSSDSVAIGDSNMEDENGIYPPEYLNSLKFSGLPNHVLSLKVGAP
ncbi:PREDICTED: uncharacterized protein LOC104774316, partial [Camelina sativa]